MRPFKAPAHPAAELRQYTCSVLAKKPGQGLCRSPSGTYLPRRPSNGSLASAVTRTNLHRSSLSPAGFSAQANVDKGTGYGSTVLARLLPRAELARRAPKPRVLTFFRSWVSARQFDELHHYPEFFHRVEVHVPAITVDAKPKARLDGRIPALHHRRRGFID